MQWPWVCLLFSVVTANTLNQFLVLSCGIKRPRQKKRVEILVAVSAIKIEVPPAGCNRIAVVKVQRTETVNEAEKISNATVEVAKIETEKLRITGKKNLPPGLKIKGSNF
jgi:hypothetical protein